ncbi:hypothetical protein RSJ42_05330 [Methanosarcina hadiensis]|uniref:hypothetical protein n=1 Tax=Methanosarcina hadiensis TaxID=3078083 RepID=UPI0039777619
MKRLLKLRVLKDMYKGNLRKKHLCSHCICNFWGRWFSPAGAIICGTAGVLITNELITNIPNDLIHYATIVAVLGSALLLILTLRPEVPARSLAAFVFLVPLGFHAYFLIAGLISGAVLNPPFLLVVSIVMSIIALGLHRSALNYWYRSDKERKIGLCRKPIRISFKRLKLLYKNESGLQFKLMEIYCFRGFLQSQK